MLLRRLAAVKAALQSRAGVGQLWQRLLWGFLGCREKVQLCAHQV